MISKLLAYTLNCSRDLSALDYRAEKAVAMVSYMWLVIIPGLAAASLQPVSQWTGLGLMTSGILVAVAGIILLMSGRNVIVGCFISGKTTAALLLNYAPITAIISFTVAVPPTLYYVGGVTDRFSLQLWSVEPGIIFLSALIVTMIVVVNVAAVFAVALSTSFIRSIELNHN